MADELRPDPATDLDEGAVDQAATQGSGNSTIADEIRDALGGEGESTLDKSPHEQMRRQIGDALAKETSAEANTDTPTETAGKPERARGADGRFIPTPQEAAAGIDPNERPVTETVQPKGPPASWTKDLQARWGEVPQDFQAQILKREADVEKGFEKYKNLRVHEPVLDYAEKAAQQLGMPAQQMVHQWAQLQEAMLDPSKRAQAVAIIQQSYGLDHVPPQTMEIANQAGQYLGIKGSDVVNELVRTLYGMADPNTRQQTYQALGKTFGVVLGADGKPQAAEPTWVDPDIAEIRQQQQRILGWQQQQEQIAQQAAQQYQQQVQHQKLSMLDQFSSEKGPDGQPLRPHYQTVMPDMVAGVARIRAANPSISDQDALQQAYDAAVWSNPTTRAQALNATMIAEKAKETEKARERAQAASRGAVSPATASPQGPPATMPAKGDIRDQMRATLEQFAT